MRDWPSRVAYGKTRAIEYIRLLLARNNPRVTTFHAQCEHKPRHAEGRFFANLLEAVGDPDPNGGSNTSKRMRLTLRIRQAASCAGSGVVLLFCDEAQRYNDNEYEWLRDVHDALDRQQIKLFTFLVGQQELLGQKHAMQVAGKTQIVARLMVEELVFSGIRNAHDVATCLNGYDHTAYPEESDWSFSRFYVPRAFNSGFRLVNDADTLWRAFEAPHHKANLPGELEVPMESFTRAVEIVLKDELRDGRGYRPDEVLWEHAVRQCGYVQSRHATGRVLVAAA
ncbi:ATP-binding protein [Caballeronia glebae]|nr:ATP-binding protein [Caballeronia glebae]